MCVGGRFAGEVSGVEFLEGGVDVVEVERDAATIQFVGVDLDDAEHLERKSSGLLLAVREADTTEGEALPADRNNSRRHVRNPQSAIARMFVDLGVWTVPDSRR